MLINNANYYNNNKCMYMLLFQNTYLPSFQTILCPWDELKFNIIHLYKIFLREEEKKIHRHKYYIYNSNIIVMYKISPTKHFKTNIHIFSACDVSTDNQSESHLVSLKKSIQKSYI